MPEKRRPVPTFARCEPTIKREARYWASRFRGRLTVGDLEGEAWIVTIKKVLPAFDPMRDVTIETYLTESLRRHFQRLVKRELTRAFLYRVEQHGQLVNELHRSNDHPDGLLSARLVLRTLASLSPSQQALARLLVKHDGKVIALGRALGWTNRDAYQRVADLRALLKKGK